jgi:hypothetical protein
MFANAWIPASFYNAPVVSKLGDQHYLRHFLNSTHTRPATQDDMELAAFANSKDITKLQYFESLAKGVKGVGFYSKAADLHHAKHCSIIIMGFGQKAGKDGAIAPVIDRCVGLFGETERI